MSSDKIIKSEDAHFRFVQRVSSYGLVSYAYDTAQYYYNVAKEKNSLIRYGLQATEDNVSRLSAPMLNAANSWGKPYLLKVDEYGCAKLDQFDTSVLPIVQDAYTRSMDRSKQIYEQRVGPSLVNGKAKVCEWKDHTYTTVTTLPSTLTNRVLDATETTIDYMLPPTDEEKAFSSKASSSSSSSESAFSRANTLRHQTSERAMRKMFRGFNNLKLRTESQVKSLPYVVDLMEYASTHIDKAKSSAKSTYHTKVRPYFERAQQSKVWQSARALSSYLYNTKPSELYNRFVRWMHQSSQHVKKEARKQQKNIAEKLSSTTISLKKSLQEQTKQNITTTTTTTTTNDDNNNNNDDDDDDVEDADKVVFCHEN